MATDRCDEIAMLMYAKMLYIGDRIKANGDGIAANMKEAVRYFKIAINKGNTESMTYYAILIERNGCCKKEVVKYVKIDGDNGHAKAMALFAEMLLDGDGVAVNKREAARYFKMAADNGHEGALNSYNMLK